MNNKVRVFSKLSFFAVVLLLFLAVLFSCSNVITDNTKNTPPTTIQPNSVKTVTITGTVRSPYAEAGQNRSARPAFSYTDTQYEYSIRAEAGTETQSGTVDAANKTFSIPLALGKVWTLKLVVNDKDDADKVVMKAEYTFSHALTESDVTTPLTLVLEPLASENGAGTINLSLSSSPTGLYDDVSVEIGNVAQRTAWNAASPSVTTGSISATSIKSGIYSVTINFYKEGVLVYSTTQDINVFDYMTTSRWVNYSTHDTPISGGNFVLTESDINRFKKTNYFVASTTNTLAGNNGNSGSPYAPLASISEALRRISETGAEDDEYTIWLLSDITESVIMSGTGTGGLNGKASSITIRAMSSPVTVSGEAGAVARNFHVTTTVSVTLENLTITSGEGIYIGTSSEVTLSNCTVTGNSVTGNGNVGGGICNLGTLKVKGKVTVTGNTQGTGSSAAANNVYLYPDKTITVIDELDPDSSIGVTTEDKPSFGSPLVFTSGFVTPGGLVADDAGTVFSSDEGYAVLAGSGTNAGEATLQASGGSMSDVFDYDVELSCVNSTIAAGSVLTVGAAVTVTNDGTPVTLDTDDITWNFELTCFDKTVVTLPSTSAAIAPAPGYARVVILSNVKIFEGVKYTLHVTATYNGIGYDNSFNLTGSSISSVPQGFVAVAGATVSGAVSDSEIFITGGTITIPNMYVCDHEVTQEEFTAVMETNPSSFNGSEGKEPATGEIQANRPAESMTWYAAVAYCNKKSIIDGLTPCYSVSGITDWQNLAYSDIPIVLDTTWNAVTCDFSANGYRLPTEAEWEYIALGGNNGIPATQTTYSGSNTIDEVAWYKDNSDGKTHEVKRKKPNSLGIYDMTGNVWELCWDDRYVPNSTSHNQYVINRGGASVDTSASGIEVRNNVKYRSWWYLNARQGDIGFRVVRTDNSFVGTAYTALAAGTDGTYGTSGTYVLFGDWPQTIKASNVSVYENIFNQVGAFTYFYGSDGNWYAKVSATPYTVNSNYTCSDGTPLVNGTEYYFKVEPIKWRVLTNSYDHDGNNGTAGKKLLLAENILINCAYYDDTNNRTIGGNTVYPNNYMHSRVRAYLNGLSYNKQGTDSSEFMGSGFLQTAFAGSLQNDIATTTVDNSLESASGTYDFSCDNTSDKIFLLSNTEASNTSIFTDSGKRIRIPTDFSKASGAYQDTTSGNGGIWWQRSPHCYANDSSKGRFMKEGGAPNGSGNANLVSYGVVPALCIE